MKETNNPQLEDGYTAISNELLEALARIRINGEARQCLDVIFRKTYGFKKKEDRISISQFVLYTGINKACVCRALNKIKQMQIVIQKDNKWSINKLYNSWCPLSKKITVIQKDNTVIQKDNNRYPKRYTQKKKENIQKKYNIYVENSNEFLLAKLLLEEIKKRNPEHKDPNIQNWSDDINKMIRIDKRNPEMIKAIILWCQQDDFWKNNILSTKKLREHFDKLVLKAKQYFEKQPSKETYIF
jgi:phage replication O-like protein O